MQIESVITSPSSCYKSFEELCKRTSSLKLPLHWIYTTTPDRLLLKNNNPKFVIPEYEIIIEVNLKYAIKMFSWFLPAEHSLNSKTKMTMNNITVSNLIINLELFVMCGGVKCFFI